ncbi:hypothetical protein [Pseudomonas poae]|uniref:Uncharacterized protein n=1 Tax=Pseudomonas poae TaxID=200451 RepID=A0A2S9E8J2_9PSED|nr:hypothetical protein [Pseudomonas poae]PRA31482.1 hypothetical protein CQZ97_08620 [Pseudomonas poae]PRC11179.1 hypothetical protein CQZ99_26545 [Pseudomonas poae]
MKHRLLMSTLLAALYMLAAPAHALNTAEVEPQTLKEYAFTLNAHAGKFQWQQLWKATRTAGYFQDNSQTYFTVPTAQVPDLVSTVLSDATNVTPFASTRATYRYDFATKVGVVNKVAVTALCVDVDWRTLPDGTDVEDGSAMKTVSLLLAKPCP